MEDRLAHDVEHHAAHDVDQVVELGVARDGELRLQPRQHADDGERNHGLVLGIHEQVLKVDLHQVAEQRARDLLGLGLVEALQNQRQDALKVPALRVLEHAHELRVRRLVDHQRKEVGLHQHQHQLERVLDQRREARVARAQTKGRAPEDALQSAQRLELDQLRHQRLERVQHLGRLAARQRYHRVGELGLLHHDAALGLLVEHHEQRRVLQLVDRAEKVVEQLADASLRDVRQNRAVHLVPDDRHVVVLVVQRPQKRLLAPALDQRLATEQRQRLREELHQLGSRAMVDRRQNRLRHDRDLGARLVLVALVVPRQAYAVREQLGAPLDELPDQRTAAVALLDQQIDERLDNVHQQVRDALDLVRAVEAQASPRQNHRQEWHQWLQ